MMKANHYLKKQLLCTSILLAIAVPPPLVWAGATFDGSTDSGTTASLSGNFTVTEADGSLRGNNLFHSFSDFNINAGESATFTGASPINNVVSRVTGSGTTTINGALISTIPNANFYFINPNGIVFKEGAAIFVDGSFYATTSDYIRFGPDDIVYAADTSKFGLITSPPSSFGFLGSNPGQITLQGTQLVEGLNLNLDIYDDSDGSETFNLIAGDINLLQAEVSSSNTILGLYESLPNSTGSLISLQDNQLNIVSVASAGEVVPINGGGYDLSTFNTLGNVNITGGSILDTNNLYIRGGNIVIDNAMIALGYTGFLFGPKYQMPANGGLIDIVAVNQFSIVGTTPMSTFAAGLFPTPDGTPFLSGITTIGGAYNDLAPGFYPPNAASINISANNISLTGAVEIKSVLQGAGTAGDINIDGNVSLADTAAIRSTLTGTGKGADINISGDSLSLTNFSVIRGLRTNSGTAGNININSKVVEVLNGSYISNFNLYAGAGGNITINADQVLLDGQNSLDINNKAITGIYATSDFNSSIKPFSGTNYYDPALTYASSGNVIINATGTGGLTVKNGAEINAQSNSFGSGGNISITASDINLSRDGKSVGSILSQSVFAGDAGDININATNNIDISGGFVITATTAGTGTGGDINISAGDTITISGTDSGVTSLAAEPTTQVKDYLTTRFFGAPYEVVFPGLDMYTGLQILHNNGIINLNHPNGIVNPNSYLNTVSPIALPVAGNAGSITLAASKLNMSNSSRITTSTTSDGHGGSININVDKLAMKNDAEIRSRSGYYINDVLTVGSGNGGDITIVASKSVSMKSGSSISSSSLGTGLAGNVYIDAGKIRDLTNSSITTQATEADGGDITIRAIDRIYLDKSDVTTSVGTGEGSGGNIDIDPEFFILKSSNILANAYGGSGGNITLVADHLITSPDSIIDASSALGIDGSINISSPDEDVSDDLTVLPDNYLDATSLLAERCGAQSGSSSLVNAGSGGITVDPDSYLPSFAVAENFEHEKTTNRKSASKQNHWSKGYLVQSEISLAQLSCNTN